MTIQQILEKGEKELEEYECTGMRCKCETTEKHYFVDDSNINTRLIELLEGLIERETTEKGPELDANSKKWDHGYVVAKKQTITRLQTAIDYLKKP